MELLAQQLPDVVECRTVNDENNNLKNLRCSSCEDEQRGKEEAGEHLSTASSTNETEFVSIDTQRLWNDIAHLVRCVYRESNSEYLGEEKFLRR